VRIPPASGDRRVHPRHLAACFLPVGVALLSMASARGLAAQAILNVERLQPRNVHGWHAGVEGSLDLARGNSSHTNVLAGFATGYRWPGDWIRIYTGIDYESKDNGRLDNDRYLHLRYNHWWKERVQSFHFVQLQGSHSSVIHDRFLLGSGVRVRVAGRTRTTFDVGGGVMYELEDLNRARFAGSGQPITTRYFRMADLLVLNRQLKDGVRFLGVGYLQPRWDDLGDMRALSDLSLFIALTDHVDLAVRYQWRHDTQPPEGVKPDDYSFTTGLTLNLR
jgi:putative salt-induced outer membrane protein YdiY